MMITVGRSAVLIGSLLAFSSCSNVGRDYVFPSLPSLSSTVLQEANADSFSDAAVVNDWWKTLEDKQLSTLIEKALRHNLDIKIALATMDESRAAATGSRLNQLPVITPNASLATIHESRQSRFGNFGEVDYNTYTAGFDASWELDLWGRVSGQVDSDNARLQAAEANLQGVYVAVAAEVARNYIELRGAQTRLDVAKKNAAIQEKIFALAQQLESKGRSNGLELERANTQLANNLAVIPALEAQVNASINRLAVLIGQTPDGLRKELQGVKPLPTLPSSIAVGDAGALLARRPDVRAAERELAASVADYNITVADLYPRITLDGNVSFVATALGNLVQGDAIYAFIQPALRWSALDRGRVNARIDAADARTKAQLANFDKIVLSALEEVDTGMVNFSREQRRRAQLAASVKSSANAAFLAKKRYDAGLDSLLDMLDSETRLLLAEDQLLASETQAVLNAVALYKALGGGWDTLPLVAADESKTMTEFNSKNGD